LDIILEMLFCPGDISAQFCDNMFPRSAILIIVHSLPSNPLELEVSSLKFLPGLESMGMTEKNRYDVAAVEADGHISDDSGSIFELNTVTPRCDGAI
jgi:hypothetical protein